jgi:hypothetical protein
LEKWLVLMRILAWKLGKCDGWFLIQPKLSSFNPTQHDPCELYNPFRTIHYHPLDISGHDGKDE